jgi:copper chaperone CopZ
MIEKIYKIKGMHCASCAGIIEKTLKKTEGVTSAHVNYATESAQISFDESKTNIENLSEKIKPLGYSFLLGDKTKSDKKENLELKEDEKESFYNETKEIVDSEDVIDEVKAIQDVPTFNVTENTIIPGIFTAETSSNTVNKVNLNIELLDIFFKKGVCVKGDEIPNYLDFKNDVLEKIPTLSEKEIKDFLLICNLFKITEFRENIGYFTKDLEESKKIIELI